MEVIRLLLWGIILSCVTVPLYSAPNSAQNQLILQHSYVTKVQYSPIKPGQKALRCTGAIYNANWIVTSSKCALYTWRRKMGNPTHDYGDLLYGEDTPLPRCKPQNSDQYRYIVDVALPPGLEKTINGTADPALDIAMLKVNIPFKFSKILKAIRVPESPKECDLKTAYLFGWGVTNGGTAEEQWNNELRKIDMDVLDGNECKEKIKNFDPAVRVCSKGAKDSKSGKESTCNSDIGGPFVKMIEIKLKQAPVASKYPFLCGVLPITACERTDDVDKANVVEYYSNVLKHANWIRKVGGKQVGI